MWHFVRSPSNQRLCVRVSVASKENCAYVSKAARIHMYAQTKDRTKQHALTQKEKNSVQYAFGVLAVCVKFTLLQWVTECIRFISLQIYAHFILTLLSLSSHLTTIPRHFEPRVYSPLSQPSVVITIATATATAAAIEASSSAPFDVGFDGRVCCICCVHAILQWWRHIIHPSCI